MFPVKKNLKAKFWKFWSFGRVGVCRFWQHGQKRYDRRVSGGEQCHQATHLVGLVLLQPTWGKRQHDGHAAGEAQMHGGLAAKEVVIEQTVASHAWVDSFQGVSPDKYLFPYHEPLSWLTRLKFILQILPSPSFILSSTFLVF